MSDAPGDNAGESGQAGGNQPQAGQPQGGQPPQAYQTGPSMGDIFSIPETRSAIKTGIATYAVLALGYAIIATGVGTFASSGSSFGGTGSVTGAFVLIELVLLLSPVLAFVLGYVHADVLDDQPDKYIYATTAVANVGGVLAVFVIGVIFAFAAAPPVTDVGGAVGDSIVPVIITMIGAAIVAAGTAWAIKRLAPGVPVSQGGAEGQADTVQNR